MVRLPIRPEERSDVVRDGFATRTRSRPRARWSAALPRPRCCRPTTSSIWTSRTGARCRWARATSSSGRSGRVYHPRSGKFLGYMTLIARHGEGERQREPKVRAVVDGASTTFDRGDLHRAGPRAADRDRQPGAERGDVAEPGDRLRAQPGSHRGRGRQPRCWSTSAARRVSRSATSSPSSARPTPSRQEWESIRAPTRTSATRSRTWAVHRRWTSGDHDHLSACLRVHPGAGRRGPGRDARWRAAKRP